LPNAARDYVPGTIELMCGERLVVLPVAQGCSLIVEGRQSAIENFQRGEFLFIGGKRQPSSQHQNKNAEGYRESKSAAHADETYFPLMPRLVTR
jgi:hypothetical protein